MIKDGQGNVILQSSYNNSYMFTGREWDSETGNYYYRARYYAPQLGRFLQTDPVVEYGSVSNLYVYVRNNPIIHTDPEGLYAQIIKPMVAGPECWEECDRGYKRYRLMCALEGNCFAVAICQMKCWYYDLMLCYRKCAIGDDQILSEKKDYFPLNFNK